MIFIFVSIRSFVIYRFLILFHKGRTREHFTCTFLIWYRVLVRMSDITTTIQLQLQLQLQVRCCFFFSTSFNLMGWCDRKGQRERTSHTWNTICFPFFSFKFMDARERNKTKLKFTNLLVEISTKYMCACESSSLVGSFDQCFVLMIKCKPCLGKSVHIVSS